MDIVDAAIDVCVVGNAGIDTNVYFPNGELRWDVEGNFTENRDYVGQAGGYTARGFAQLGVPTAFIGSVGDDRLGRWILDAFRSDGIDTDGVFIDPRGTARSVNLVDGQGHRRNFYDGKGHMDLIPDFNRCGRLLRSCRLAHFHIPNWARKLLPLAKAADCVIGCDIQDVEALFDGYRDDFIHHADILFFSAANHGDPEPLMEEILDRYPDKILISGMGDQGCALGTAQGRVRYPPVDSALPVVDTNGAGDALAVGFLWGHVLQGYDLKTSIRLGQVSARHTCAQKASTSTLITREALLASL